MLQSIWSIVFDTDRIGYVTIPKPYNTLFQIFPGMHPTRRRVLIESETDASYVVVMAPRLIGMPTRFSQRHCFPKTVVQ